MSLAAVITEHFSAVTRLSTIVQLNLALVFFA